MMQRPHSVLFALLVVACLTPAAFCQKVIATVPVGNRPTYVATDQQANRIYVSNQLDDTVSVIDGSTNAVLATVRVGRSPNGIAVNPKTNRIYVANLQGGSVSIINGAKLTAFKLWLGANPAKLAVNTSTDRVYVTLEDQNGVLDVINGRDHTVSTSISLPPYPLSVAVDRYSNRIYVADFLCGCGQISVIDGETNQMLNPISLPGSSMVVGVSLDARDGLGYATDENSGFYVFSLASGEVLGGVSGLSYPNEVTAIPGTALAVEPDTGSNHAVFIDAKNLRVRKRVRVGRFPTGVAVNALTKRVYVANRASNTVSVIQLPREW
jgi:YVTN family beta-propeller protein